MGIVPTLRSGEQTINDDQGKAQALLETFFPPLPDVEDEPPRDRFLSDALPLEIITDHEIEVALVKMASWKAPGPDGLPVVVWQQVWPTVKHWIVEIFQASLRLSYLPRAWKVAKIVVIPKGGRDPSLPKSYRPISLLTTLGKVLEAVTPTESQLWLRNTNYYPQTISAPAVGDPANRRSTFYKFKSNSESSDLGVPTPDLADRVRGRMVLVLSICAKEIELRQSHDSKRLLQMSNWSIADSLRITSRLKDDGDYIPIAPTPKKRGFDSTSTSKLP